MTESTVLPPCPDAAQVRGQQVTAEEIAHIERILRMIDLRNVTLANISKYLLVWEVIREIDNRLLHAPHGVCRLVSEAFIQLLEVAERRGGKLLQMICGLGISSEQMVVATDCDSESFQACVKLVSDKLRQWRGIDLDETVISRIWAGVPNEPESAVS